jgi:uncharacterized protein YbcC (UPF0753/DUF2309 family)
MAAPQTPSIEERIAALEQKVKELREHVATLERLASLQRRDSSKPEHPVDTAMTRQKVTYDWQA